MVMAVIVVAGALASRPPPVAAIMLLLAVVRPWWCVPALASAGAIAKRATPDPDQLESVYLHAVAMELRAGAGLRGALSLATDRTPDLPLERVKRLASVGASLDLVAEALVGGLPEQGRVAATALRTAGRTGGQVAAVFENLAQVSTEDREMRRETREPPPRPGFRRGSLAVFRPVTSLFN